MSWKAWMVLAAIPMAATAVNEPLTAGQSAVHGAGDSQGIAARESETRVSGEGWIHENQTERFDFAPGGTIRFMGSHGDLNIVGWDRPEVEVTVNKSSKRLYAQKDVDAAKKRLDLITVKAVRKSAGELEVRTAFPSRTLKRLARGKSDLMMEYQIHVPRQSHIVAAQDIGAITISGVAGDMEAHVGKGDIVVVMDGPESYAVDAKSRFGGVASDAGGEGTGKFGHRQLAFAPAGAKYKLHLRTGIGSITVKQTTAAKN